MQILITGVAGYIGAHVANCFLESGYEVIGIDNLSTGNKLFIDPRIKFIQGDAQDYKVTCKAFDLIEDIKNSGVIHCAGYKFAGESVKTPLDFYENNTATTLNILKTMNKFEISKIVFSSSCSVYGDLNSSTSASESTQTNPVSPYGRSKYFAENIIKDFTNTGKIKAASLRYFNVAGNGKILACDTSEFNLFPNIYRAIENSTEFQIYGDDYATPDGTCIRDYVDVNELSQAHYLVYESLSNRSTGNYEVYNIGSGVGYSVNQIVEIAKSKIDPNLKISIVPRRDGDPSKIIADTSKANKSFDWQHKSSCEDMLISGWQAWNRRMN